MNKYLKVIVDKMGMDKAIAYSSGARIIQSLTGVISIFFITRYLTGVEQGFYYTFGSILAIQVFFELGFTGIITQYVAHEASHLILKEDYTFSGEQKYKSRLASLLKFTIKWYSIVSLLFFIVLLLIGYVFFDAYNNNDEVSWKLPWFILVFSTSVKLFQSPLTSILMGVDKVKEMNKIGFYQQIILPISAWIGLIFGFKLYVIGISSLLSVIIWNVYIARSKLQLILINLWKVQITERIRYMEEIFPFQWKIALSWISGYFIFQLFNPVLFATEGPIVAGQMGMTLTVLNGIQALSLSWLNTKVPLYSRLIALKDYVQLDKIFTLTLKQMVSVCFILLMVMLLGIWILRYYEFSVNGNLLGDRFLPYFPLLLMMSTLYINQYVASWATYLRCHKQEPFLLNSICGAVANALSTIILGKYYGLLGITIGYFLITLAFLPWGYNIYKTNKCKWHEE